MTKCINCGSETTNKKFCSKSCSSSHTNRTTPKRKQEGKCCDCGTSIPSQLKRCAQCRTTKTPQKQQIKKCVCCGELKPSTDFYTRKSGRLFSYCKQCSSKRADDYRRVVKDQCIQYKGGKCCVCGYDRHPAALQFHHTDPTKKELTIASSKYSFEKLKEELDKCDLVCANCHSIIHSSYVKENGLDC
jgi:hypothetical protein